MICRVDERFVANRYDICHFSFSLTFGIIAKDRRMPPSRYPAALIWLQHFFQYPPYMPIAQINIARMVAPLESTKLKEFRDFLGPVNSLAESSPGFLWRYADENAFQFEMPWADDMILVNLSLWKDVAALQNFTYQTVHSYFIKSKKKWFHQLDHPHYVLWWVEEGHIPTLVEGKEKLDLLLAQGPTEAAFLFQQAPLFLEPVW